MPESIELQRIEFDIQQLPANKALQIFAKQANLQVLFSAELVKGLKANSISGFYSIPEAIAQVLSGTGLQPKITDSRILTITADNSRPSNEERQVDFKKKQLSGIIAFLTAMVSNSATQAQEIEPGDHIEQMIVTGSYQKSLEKAVDIKRNSIGFSDSVVASDIADFPEQNLAEALQRIPGVTIERNKGLGNKVNVRSLPSEFTHVSINNLATASGSGGRDVEFDMFASDIIQQVKVKKSPTAADEEGGIAGTVEIQTARPFDYSGRKVIVSAEGAYNTISEEVDPNFSLLASNTVGNWGALVSFSSSQRTNRTDANSGVDFRPLSRWLEKSGSSQHQSDQAAAVLERDTGIVINDRFNDDETGRVVFLNKAGDRAYLNEQEKWGATASIQFKPSNNFSLTFDALVGKYDATEDEYDAAAYSASSPSSLAEIHDYDSTTLSDYGITVLTDTSYALTQHEFLSKEDVNETDYQQFSLASEWSVGLWSIDGLLGYSGAEKFSDRTNLKHTSYAPSRTRYTDQGGQTLMSDDPDSIDMYNAPSSYLFDFYDVTLEEIQDDKYAAQFDVSREMHIDFLPALADIHFGVRYTDKSKKRNQGDKEVKGPSADDSSWSGVRTLQDSELTPIEELVPGGEYLPDLSYSPSWAQVSNEYARDLFRYDGFHVDYAPDQYYQVDEEVFSLYAMADFEFDILSRPALINAGFRYVDTSVLSSGFHQVQTTDGSTVYTSEPVSKDGSYDDLLPSFNMKVELSENLMFRAAASQTLMRPALTDIAYKRSVSLSEFKYYDGNPDLQPTYADQWELGVEYYLESGGILSASYFEKEIEGVVRESLTGIVPNVTKYNDNGTLDGVYDFEVYQKINAEGSYDVSGVELVAQFPLTIISESLEGFGINANYTILDNSLTGESDLNIPTAPEGLAENTYNLVAYYENDRFNARILYNYKDKYVERIERDMYPVYRDSYGQLDLSLGFYVTENIKLSLEGINITEEATQGYTMDPRFPTMYEVSGSRYTLGVRANF
ncbi:TonB-dependent receptor [Gilvimarinus sp. 1_MG-2023]|uniref:TonB-dependent receptor n=1 Tax=Gilvimarinus sp. 1_MG-2023 TaxID=3062638 RepID=UPI0026E16A43|nr:TonB-dependent receptor [Gilvimarinus sp. 1_MG-2023]MDO6745833.1 TonB-dependent receptor [Gilvimarinus sp. 1_MG-2023]